SADPWRRRGRHTKLATFPELVAVLGPGAHVPGHGVPPGQPSKRSHAGGRMAVTARGANGVHWPDRNHPRVRTALSIESHAHLRSQLAVGDRHAADLVRPVEW